MNDQLASLKRRVLKDSINPKVSWIFLPFISSQVCKVFFVQIPLHPREPDSVQVAGLCRVLSDPDVKAAQPLLHPQHRGHDQDAASNHRDTGETWLCKVVFTKRTSSNLLKMISVENMNLRHHPNKELCDCIPNTWLSEVDDGRVVGGIHI